MYMNCDTNTGPSNSDQHNQVYNNNNKNGDGIHKSTDTQQDNVGIDNMSMPCIGHNDGPKVIRTREE